MRHGLCVASIGSYGDPRSVVRLARAAEESGWEAFFLWDHLAFAWDEPACDPWVTLAACAAATERILLGTAVTPLARRRPQVVAHEVASVALLSGGRFVLGAGLGGKPREFAAFGEDPDDHARAELLDEGLDVVARLLRGERVSHRGRLVVDDVALAPLPPERVPVWIGGASRPALRRAARWDGWLADGADSDRIRHPPGWVAAGLERIRRAREGDAPFEVAFIGYADQADLAAYADAGVTWWLESVHDRRGDADAMQELVRAGPNR